jgi:hypothetical protein
MRQSDTLGAISMTATDARQCFITYDVSIAGVRPDSVRNQLLSAQRISCILTHRGCYAQLT